MRGFLVGVLVLGSVLARAQPSPSPAPQLFANILPPRADPPYAPPVFWSMAAGMATGLVGLAVGGAMNASESRSDKLAGTYLLMTGLTLAPAVSHLVAREWKRAAIFGAIPAAALLGMVGLLESVPGTLDEGNKDPVRVGYVILLAFGVVSSAGGIVDSLWAGERAKEREAAARVSVAPLVGGGRWGLALGGNW
jgi:hypothetical protein